jgi:hypothetical protein
MRTKLRCFIILMLLALPAAVLAQQVFQYDTSDGYYNYTTNNGTITIEDYEGSDTTLTIPDSILVGVVNLPVTSIGNDAFYQAFSLTSVTIGTNVTIIGTNAFFYCPSLANVMIPGSVTNIGEGPFVDCQSLTVISLSASNLYYSVTNELLFNKTRTSLIQYPGGLGGSYTIPANVTNVGEAFIGNTLTAISVNSTNLYYGSTNGVLFDKTLTLLIEYPGGAGGSYTVPRIVTTIEPAAFEYSIGVAGVTIGTNVTSIGGNAFYDCTNLTAISVNSTNLYYSSSNGVLFDKTQSTLIQYPGALGGSYTIPGTVTNIESGAFGDAFNLTSVVIPNSVTSIGVETFYSCESLTSVTMGDGVASIGEEAFNECTSLTGITIPSSVTNIGEYAFYYCPDLTSVTIGSGVTGIGEEAFADCESLANACFEGNEPSDGGSIFAYDDALSTIYYIYGTAGWGVTYDGISTATCTECGESVPQLAIIPSGANVILTWSANFTGFTLQSTTNLDSPADWTTVSPAPVIINGNNTVTNSISRTGTFYRLLNP